MRIKRQALSLASLWTLIIVTSAGAQNAVVSNVEVSLSGTVATITYDLSGSAANISIIFSKDAGGTYPFGAPSATGDLGSGVTPGTGKTIAWDIAADHPAECIPQASIGVVPYGGPAINMAMVSVPAGSFEMGDSFGEGGSDELPVHTVTLSAYEIGTYEVTNAQVAAVYNWANGLGLIDTVDANAVTHNGVELLSLGSPYWSQIIYNGVSGQLEVRTRDGFPLADHPVVLITWYGSVAFCNWLSLLEGRAPVYDLATWSRVTPTGGGYRLPTEAEWERAAGWDATADRQWRYGTGSDSITWWGDANYSQSNPLALTSQPYTTPVGFYAGITSPVGCYDMSGNVWERCEDWYSSNFYSTGQTQDPINKTGGELRVLRGGSWESSALSLRSACRLYTVPANTLGSIGFRVVRGSGSR
jgi:formylglycine-generating enzyme required for sulfatase activity